MSDETVKPQPLIYGSILGIMADVGAIGKERKNDKQGYNFRGIDDAMNALHHLLAKHSVFVTNEVVEHAREKKVSSSGGELLYSILKMRYHFWAVDGSSVTTEVIGEGMDSGDKASNKALAVALKYALLQIFMIPTRETFIDPEKDSPEVGKLKPLKIQNIEEVIPAEGSWKHCQVTFGAHKGKELGLLKDDEISPLYEEYGFAGKPTTKQGKELQAALLKWKAEQGEDNLPF